MAFTSTVVVETVDTTEHDLITDAAYSSATMQAAARFSTVIDVSAMTAAEEYRFRVYSHDGTTALVVWEATRIGAQNEPVRTPEFMLNAWAVTADKIAGTARSLRSITLREDSAPTAAVNASTLLAASLAGGGTVGGQLDIIAAASTIADAVWDELLAGHAITGSYGQWAQSGVLASGTASAGSATTITLAGASAVNDFYTNTAMVVITGGTGAGQARAISGYVGATKVATVATWATTPDNTSKFVVVSLAPPVIAAAPSAAAVAAAVVAATVLRTGTATAGDLSSITLDAGAPTTVDLFKGAIIEIISGTGAGQCETITSYTAGRRAYVTSFVTAPDGTSVYIIRGAPGRLIISVRDDLARVLGISKDNAMLDRTVYSGGKMTGARLRVFGDASELAAATADTPSDNDDGEIQRYTVAATYSGDDLVSYSMVREL
jgi:hypothetical protein